MSSADYIAIFPCLFGKPAQSQGEPGKIWGHVFFHSPGGIFFIPLVESNEMLEVLGWLYCSLCVSKATDRWIPACTASLVLATTGAMLKHMPVPNLQVIKWIHG